MDKMFQCLYNDIKKFESLNNDLKEELKEEPKEENKNITETLIISNDIKKHKNYLNFVQKNKEKIKQRITCPICRGSYTYFNKSTHLKSKKHLNFLV